tara:strand:+ start:163 stop:414 length:252 start_codon:yes stop_codon:yes gene_type:complete
MNKPKITIHNIPVDILDAIILYLESGQGELEYIEAIAKDLRKVREQYTNEQKLKEELAASRPNEKQRITSANPVSVEHTKEGK